MLLYCNGKLSVYKLYMYEDILSLFRYKDWFCVSKNKKQIRKYILCIVNILKIVKSFIF